MKTAFESAAALALAVSALTLTATAAGAFDNRHTVRPSVPYAVYGQTWDGPPPPAPWPPWRSHFLMGPPPPGAVPVYVPPTFRFTGGYPYATPAAGLVYGIATWP